MRLFFTFFLLSAQLSDYTTYKESFTFEGWYLDETCTQPVTTVKMNKNITVYAKWRANQLSDLNSEDHFAYIVGYPDGTFSGNICITRAEFATLLTRFFGVDDTAQADFVDVSRSHWAYQYIATAQERGYMVGHNGEFRPEDSLSRAEAMTTLNRLLNRGIDENSETGAAIRWPDNPQDAWYYYEVTEATNDHEHSGTRPSEDWPSLEIDYHYDIQYYEAP